MKLSIVLPTYNEAGWLSDTVEQLNNAFAELNSSLAELIIVDDGSTDNTKTVVENLLSTIPIIYLKQKNKGRFLARKTGINRAKYDYILLIDSRVHIHKQALSYINKRLQKNSDEVVWNAHVVVDKKNNVFASFWDVITNIAWRKYFANPRHISFGLDEFDYYPKGTTCFFIKSQLLRAAVADFKTESIDFKRANDDTLLIEAIASQAKIHISPQFSCTYHARGTLKKFLIHAYHRGQVFVDGFLKPGNRYYYPLVFFLLASVLLPVSLVVFPEFLLYGLIAIPIVILGAFVMTQAFRIKAITVTDSVWFALLLFPFTLYYGAGIWVAVFRKTGMVK